MTARAVASKQGGKARPTLREIRDGAVIVRAAAILLAYFFLVALALRFGPAAWLITVPACSFLLSGALNAAHDCVHNTHLRSRALNRVTGAAWCTPILVNFTVYKRQHLVHHRFTGVEGDTEAHAQFSGRAAVLREMTGILFWRSIVLRIVQTFRGDYPASIRTPAHATQAQADNAVICLWLAAASASTLFFPTALLAGYWLPLLFYPCFAIFFSLPEHYGLSGPRAEGPRSRNVLSNPLVRLVQWNANFHAAHHRAPSIPAVALDDYHRRIAVGCGDAQERSYLHFYGAMLRKLKPSSPLDG